MRACVSFFFWGGGGGGVLLHKSDCSSDVFADKKTVANGLEGRGKNQDNAKVSHSHPELIYISSVYFL